MKNKIKITLFTVSIVLFLSACTNQPQPYDYSSFLQSKPRSLLVLMPTNESTDIKASPAIIANSLFPLSEAGYYVFPVALVNDTFKYNGIYEANEIHQIPLHKLKQIFDADAVLYMNIKEYGSTYVIINSVTKVSVEAKLIDLNNGKVLWEKTATASNESQSSGSLVGILVNAIAKQIADTLTDASFDLSAQTDMLLFSTDCKDCLLYGPYSPKYAQDIQLRR